MAIALELHCDKCGEYETAVVPDSFTGPYICSACKLKEKKLNDTIKEKAKAEHFAELDKLSPAQRLRLVEEWIYDHST